MRLPAEGPPTPLDEQHWRRYLGVYHDTRPGITERLFRLADASPYKWLARALPAPTGTVVDLACGSAPLRELLPDARWIGVDASAGELAEAARRGRRPLVRADATALPVRSASADAVCASMCLPVLTPLPLVLGEIRRVLRPGGTLAALVPAQSGLSVPGALAWIRVMYRLRALCQPWPNPGARDGLAALLRSSGFRVRSDERRVFALRLDTPQAVALLVEGLYLPRLSEARARAAKRALADWARPGRRLELPLRRVVAEPVLRPGE
ncbi:class I SAM-dependent methyltransferase [Streptomyces sp. NPDC001406]|uniref:class I SAM-dependent methyltransferase n=1 Tax=Streptomyces sp. NPDC001406 TaxID=3364572 RepID=UPI00369355FA